MNRREILDWLHEEDPARLEELWTRADRVRRREVGDEVHLRGLIEISNVCVRTCGYCGLRAENTDIQRYRMSADEIRECLRQTVQYGYGTAVLQAGEDPQITRDWMADLIRWTRRHTPLAMTLSLGERSDEDLRAWRDAGADRYLLRFETSNRRLFEHIHPPAPGSESCDRFAVLRSLRKLGYEVGSGVMIGIPGQTYEDLAADVETFAELGLDMIGVGPFIPHPSTPLGSLPAAAGERQVLNTEAMTYKVLALTRLACPKANIPSTTALATLNLAQGRELGLERGANVCMPNVTPQKYRAMYEIYPAKACINDDASACHGCMRRRIESIGRTVGQGRGDSPNYTGSPVSSPAGGGPTDE
jgi:biotin synthase